MKKLALGLAALTMGAIVAGDASANINRYTGGWVNVNPNSGGVTRLRILRNGGLVRVRAFGQCRPTDCNWGIVRAIAFGPNISIHPFSSTRTLMAAFSPSHARKIMIIERVGANRLRVKVLTRFVDGSGRKPYSRTYTFRRGGGAGPIVPPVTVVREDCVGFNPATTTVRRFGMNWKLVDGGHHIKSFGVKAGEALRSLRIIRAYRLNRICFVGRPGASMEYFKRNASLPAGNVPGQDCLAINPFAMAIRPIAGKYVLVQGSRRVKAFPSLAEARQGLRIMRKLRARHSCFIGRPGPSMTYLRRA